MKFLLPHSRNESEYPWGCEFDLWPHSVGWGSSIAVSVGQTWLRSHIDPALLWLWYRPAAVALIWPLAWELPYAICAALKNKQTKKKSKLSFVPRILNIYWVLEPIRFLRRKLKPSREDGLKFRRQSKGRMTWKMTTQRWLLETQSTWKDGKERKTKSRPWEMPTVIMAYQCTSLSCGCDRWKKSLEDGTLWCRD